MFFPAHYWFFFKYFVVGFSWFELLSFDKITNCVFLWFLLWGLVVFYRLESGFMVSGIEKEELIEFERFDGSQEIW